jgi:formylglycine-generating enzyme required for sulfatase activity
MRNTYLTKDTAKYTVLLVTILLLGCKEGKKDEVQQTQVKADLKESIENHSTQVLTDAPQDVQVPDDMVWIPGGIFTQGAVPQDNMAMEHEKPGIQVAVDGFFMDKTEVTNAQFATFVAATGYVTVAERAIDWEELKKQVPEGTEKPHDSVLQPGALTFKKAKSTLPNLYDFSQWWQWTIGANWRHPNGPKSSIKGKGDHPVVQIAYEDAVAYCDWAGKRLPTEAEWELAARGGNFGTIFFWGDDATRLATMANSWEGQFPVVNSVVDGYELRAPVKSYEPNALGLYDMAGNVWEWTSDWYNAKYYKQQAQENGIVKNPKGARTPFTPNNPYAKEKVIKGGSFLCSDSYCASYRVSARMGSSMDSALEHTGFRTVATPDMLKK